MYRKLAESSRLGRTAATFVHSENIRRYERLLKTDLTDDEREFIMRRLAEERVALSRSQVACVGHILAPEAEGRR